ncbi:MAG: flagellar brake protein [Bacillota bacterium]
MANFNLYTGQKVNLRSSKQEIEYKAEVIGINAQSIDLQLLETNQKKLSSLVVGQDYIISFEGSNVLYELEVKIKRITNKVNALLVVKPIGDLQKIKRRRYMRVTVGLTVEYRLLGEEPWVEAVLVDMSASGMKIAVNSIEGLRTEQKIELSFSNLDQFPLTKIIARILRIQVNQNSSGSGLKYYLGLEFISTSKDEREKLIKWIQKRRNE